MNISNIPQEALTYIKQFWLNEICQSNQAKLDKDLTLDYFNMKVIIPMYYKKIFK